MQWLRRSFVAGFFATVPLFVTVAALIWIFNIVDGATTPLYDRLIGRRIPGLGTLSTAAAIVLVGTIARNVIGRRVVVVEDPRRGYAIGFQTREFTVDRGHGPEPLIAVYVPTNNLYLGDVVIVERSRALFPDITVEDGIRIFLTGGMALPPEVRL